MRCKYCNIDVACESKVCPLCHEKLPIPENLDMPYQPEKAYPDKQKTPKRKKRKLSVTKLYVSIALTLFILSIPINMLTTPQLYWFAIVGVLVIYGFILIANTILSNNGIGIKIFWQAVGILAVLLTVNYLIDKQAPEDTDTWVWDYGLPSILIIASITTGIYTTIAFKYWSSAVLDTLIISALGYLPLILFVCKVIAHPVLAIISTCVSTVIIIFCCILGRRTLISELKKKFHV
ncbi:MAG: hypothetical protein K2I46_04120 [Clostridia bacterium]|nr:hypothetical protein [Clostridia bacterium]MDE6472591.1 hypothetical protein [Clostridia bacterium]